MRRRDRHIEMTRKHSFRARLRAFRIWQQLGRNPWRRQRAVQKQGGDFYKGAFTSIPFLDDDAKRTFVHLLFRPGYMIRDYIKGDHERYLAPLTALIVFYAFFTVVSAVLQPLQPKMSQTETMSEQVAEEGKNTKTVSEILRQGENYLRLDEHPELVDTRAKSAIAALEGTLRSKGITLFLGNFFLLWLSMGLCLRRYHVPWSAAAAASAYVLCLFCFAMFFVVIATLGERNSLGLSVLFLLLVVVYRQWFSAGWLKSMGLAIKTWAVSILIYALFVVTVTAGVILAAVAKGEINFME